MTSPDTRPLPALDILGPPSSACPGQPLEQGPALPLTCLLAGVLSAATPPPLWGPRACQAESNASSGEKGLQLWAPTPRQAPAKRCGPGALVSLHSRLRACGDPASGALLLPDFGDLVDLSGTWSFPSHARASDVSWLYFSNFLINF